MNVRSKLQPWFEARKRHRLSDAHIQMARELGMNPKKLGKIDNHRQEAWKAPLPDFIEHLYSKQFRRDRPIGVKTLEETVRALEVKKIRKRQQKEAKRKAASCAVDSSSRAIQLSNAAEKISDGAV
jgi:hypothetical protein